MDPDLMLDPDESLSDDDMASIDDDDAYYNDDDLFSNDDTVADTDVADDDDDADTLVRDKVHKKVKTFKSWLKDVIDPLKRAKSKYIRAKAKHIKSEDKNATLKLKLGAKKVGLLSMAALAIKMMMDHHQDKITSDNEKTLLKLYAEAKKKADSDKKNGRPTDPIMLALGHVNRSDVNKVLNDASATINEGKQLANTNYSQLGNQATAFGKNWLNNLASSFGINTSKFGAAFHNFLGMFKGI